MASPSDPNTAGSDTSDVAPAGGSAAAGTGAGVAPARDTGTSPQIIAIKVQFELDSPDGLRKVTFGLEKDTPNDEVIWKINFGVSERTSTNDDFATVITLSVEVDETLHSNAEAASKGLTSGQVAHATGPAADRAKAAKLKQIPQSAANRSIQGTLKAQ